MTSQKFLSKITIVLIPIVVTAAILAYDSHQKQLTTERNQATTTSKEDNKTTTSDSTKPSTNQPTATEVDPLIIPEAQRKNVEQGVWIPYWGMVDGLNSLNAKTTKYTNVSPVWYEINKNGTLISKKGTKFAEVKQFCSTNSIDLMPTIASFDWQTIQSILGNPQYTATHISAIVKEVSLNNYAGIDLDYESTKLEDKEKYQAFIKELATQLHLISKKLSVTVLAQWGDSVTYSALSETRQVQEWTFLGQQADQIRIMAYDYTTPSNKLPGPIGPLYWSETVLRYAVTKMPREKFGTA